MRVLCISGKARHGKDTFAGSLSRILKAAGKSVLVTHYADLVKYICKSFFDWDGVKDEAGRTLLQHVGTEIFRSMDPNYWVNFICSVLNACPDKWDFVLIPDCRFPNEISCMKNAGFDTVHINVLRPDFENGLTQDQASHSSETALNSIEPDVTVINDCNLKSLFHKANLFLSVNYGINLADDKLRSIMPEDEVVVTEHEHPYNFAGTAASFIESPTISMDTITTTVLSRDSIAGLVEIADAGTDSAIRISDRFEELQHRQDEHDARMVDISQSLHSEIDRILNIESRMNYIDHTLQSLISERHESIS